MEKLYGAHQGVTLSNVPRPSHRGMSWPQRRREGSPSAPIVVRNSGMATIFGTGVASQAI